MSAAHWHLVLNHFPIIGSALALPILLLALLLRRERGLLLAGVLLLVVAAGSAIASVKTGEAAMVELDLSGVPLDYSNEHEERAETATPIACAAAVLGIVVLFLAHRRPAENPLPRLWMVLVLAGAAVTAGAMGRVGNVGGGIRHKEVRGDWLDSFTPGEADEEREPR